MSKGDHICEAMFCGEVVGGAVLFCQRHWRMVSVETKRRLSEVLRERFCVATAVEHSKRLEFAKTRAILEIAVETDDVSIAEAKVTLARLRESLWPTRRGSPEDAQRVGARMTS